ncbi:MAG: putative deoxyribonuclease RhsC [Syntrophorhabdus sp. PtaB.Bin006]|nr:MAG: putative deoxyribonuclease RhsC [Syntrophorhabdus sp. PtaB.Bin006]
MTMFQAEMDFDAWRGAKVPPPGGVPSSYIEDRAVPQVTKQSAKGVRPYDGSITGLTYGNNLSLTRTYDNQYRISSITVGSLLNLVYGYDANGNITSIIDAISPSGGAPLETSATYTYQQGSNKLTHIEAPVSWDFGYDANGNITSENTRTFTYDRLNRLITVRDSPQVASYYYYNALNQRTRKTTPTSTKIFHYDTRGHLIAETNLAGATLVEYVYLNDHPLAMIRSGSVYYYHTDHLGTPPVLTDSSGAVAWKAAYGAFGAVNITVANVENNIRFPGQYYDTETGLHYNWNRYYDPKTGRYITPDPIGLEGGVNVYGYVEANPINKIDPEGTQVLGNQRGQPLTRDRQDQGTKGVSH